MPLTTAQSVQLATEINTDPKTLGYATPKQNGDDGAIAAKLNATYAGVGVVWRKDLSAKEILAGLVWTEVATMPTNSWLAFNAMLIPLTVDASNVNIQNFFAGLFSGVGFTTTLANISAAAKVVSPSRAAELWGAGTVVTATDVAHALGRG